MTPTNQRAGVSPTPALALVSIPGSERRSQCGRSTTCVGPACADALLASEAQLSIRVLTTSIHPFSLAAPLQFGAIS